MTPALNRILLLVLSGTVVSEFPPREVLAQEDGLPTASVGSLRIGVTPLFWSYDSRFGFRRDGTAIVQEEEPLGFDLSTPALGTAVIPGLAPLELALQQALRDPGFRLDLGRSRTVVTASGARIPLRVDLSITDWLSVGAVIPFVRRRTEFGLSLVGDSTDANVGFSPSIEDPTSTDSFLAALSASVSEVGLRADQICEDLGSTNAECRAIRELHSDAESFASALTTAYGSLSLFPLLGSPAGHLLTAYLSELSTGAGEYGIGSVPTSLPLAQDALDTAGLRSLIADSRFGISLDPLIDWQSRWSLGDIELHTTLHLRSGRTGDSVGDGTDTRYAVGAGVLLRFGTGSADDPSRLFDEGSGDGQTDIEFRLVGGLTQGRRLGIGVDLLYGVQLAGERSLRIGAPEALLTPISTLSRLSWRPGNYWSAQVAPRFHLTPQLALGVRYRYGSKGEDAFRWTGEALDSSLDPSVLNRESAFTIHEAGVGIVFSTLNAAGEEGGRLPPYEIHALYRGAVGGSGGATPKAGSFRVGVRFLWSLWEPGA